MPVPARRADRRAWSRRPPAPGRQARQLSATSRTAAPHVGVKRGGIPPAPAAGRGRDADFAGCLDQGQAGRLWFAGVRRCHARDAWRRRAGSERDPVHRLQGTRTPGQCPCAAAAGRRSLRCLAVAGPSRDNPKRAIAVSLFRADLQQPPHSLRPALCHGRRGVSRARCPRPVNSDASARPGGPRVR